MINKLNPGIKTVLSSLLLLAALGMAGGCSQKGPEAEGDSSANEPALQVLPVLSAEEQLFKEVMDIHDQAMLGMSEIRRLSLQLSDSIEYTGVNPMEQEETINLYRNRLQDLKSADEAMRQWMRDFDYQKVEEEAKMEYLRQEKEKIEKVDNQMNKAMAAAREAMHP